MFFALKGTPYIYSLMLSHYSSRPKALCAEPHPFFLNPGKNFDAATALSLLQSKITFLK
jgi:hypothetical protein